MSKEDNGAQPSAEQIDLRDRFAGQALHALLISPNITLPRGKTRGISFDAVARDAYGFADAMLEARKK